MRTQSRFLSSNLFFLGIHSAHLTKTKPVTMSFDLAGLICSTEPWIRTDSEFWEMGRASTHCKVCNKWDMDNDDYSAHLDKKSHEKRVKQAERAFEEEKTFSTRRHQVASLKPRISTLTVCAWRDCMYVNLFMYLMKIESTALDIAMKVLENYENIE